MMKYLLPLIFLILVSAFLTIRFTSKPENDYSYDSLISMLDRYVLEARNNDIALDFMPQIIEWTRPSMISWRQEKRAVAVPVWKELNEKQKDFISKISGNKVEPLEIFNSLFRWFLIPHELTHAFQDNIGKKQSPSKSERNANDVAVAFLMLSDKRERLERLERILESIIATMPKPNNDDFFDQNYDNLSQEPEQYAIYQFSFILDSLRRKRDLSFREVLYKAIR